MEEDGEDLTPFWVQSTTNRSRVRRFRHGVSSFLLSSGLLVSILLITAVSFLVFVVPSTISFSSQIFRPNNVKKSWDSLNLVLVLLALVFGFLSRNKNEDRNFDEYQTTSPSSTRTETQKSNPSTPQGWYHFSSTEAEKPHPSNPPQWYGYSDQTADNTTSNSKGGGLLRRTSSSYPDLLVASSRLISRDDPWKCYDDTSIETPWYSGTGQLHRRRSWKYKFGDTQLESSNLYVDKFVNHPKEQPSNPPAHPPPSSPPPAAPPSPPSPLQVSPPVPPDNAKPKRTHQSAAHKRERRRKRKDNQLEYKEPVSEPATPPPPPPPPPLPQFVDQRSGKSEKKRTGGNATKDFLNSLYHKKKKKQRQKSVENFDALLHEPQMPPLHFQLPPPSASPPPQSPPSVFQNLFSSKKSKRKTTHSVISVPIPPPPPPPATAAISSRPKTTQKHPQPVKVRSFDNEEGNSNSGGESPIIPIPPPPPPPPFFKSPAWKFVVQGDYVRVNSNLSSRSGSPDLDDVESDGTPTAADGGDASPFPQSPLFCSSPDVDTKAESFISKFRAGLKLEKMDSMNKRQGVGLSNLGPGSGPTHV